MTAELAYTSIRPADLPAPPKAALEIMRACSQPNITHRELGDIAHKDPILSAELLRVVNSPFFGLGKEVSSVSYAVTILGLKALRNLVLCISVRDALGKQQLTGLSTAEFWEDALRRAVACKLLAGYKKIDPDECFTLGLLQDFGLLILFHLYPNHASCWPEIRKIDPDQRLPYEQNLFNTTHDYVMQMLAKTWKLPSDMGQVLGFHHTYESEKLDNKALDKCEILQCADWCSYLYVSQGEGDILERTRDKIKSAFNISADEIDSFLAQLPIQVEEAAKAMGLRVTEQIDFSQLIKQANVKLAEENISYQELTWQLNNALKERDKYAEELNRELTLAQEIQQHLLPQEDISNIPVYGINKAAKILSGDFFDFYQSKKNRIYFNLADVSGKGITAALLMTKACSLFRCLGKRDTPLVELMDIINQEICETAIRGMFVTMVGGCYDPVKDQVSLVNAGHIPVLICRPDGKFVELSAQSAPVGIMPETEFKEITFSLGNNCVYAFTDGVTEARFADGKMLELAGIKKLISEFTKTPAKNRLEEIINSLSRDANVEHDDITMLLLDCNHGR